MDFHHYEEKHQAALRRVEKANISVKNKELIFKYHNALILENLSKPRLMKYLETLKMIAQEMNTDLDKATIDDVKKFVAKVQLNSNYSPWTKKTYKIIIRRFYKWLYGTKQFPEIVEWINTKISRSERRLPSEGDLLTENDIQKLLQMTEHPRDKAFISILWEAGARIGEIGTLCMKHVVFDKHGTIITVKGKTGSRKIRLIASTPHLSTWINCHPLREDKESALWLNIGAKKHHDQMTYGNMRMLLKNLFEKAGIKKRFNPHLFRHSRATFMANHLTEFQMNQYFGWIQGSDMPSTYVHMSGKEVDSAILQMNGIKTEINKEEIKIMPLVCLRCDTINTMDSKHCNKCGGILDLKYALELDEQKNESENAMNVLLKDKAVQEFLLGKLKELKGLSL